MKRIVCFLAVIFTTGCMASHSTTSCDYDCVGIGEHEETVIERIGKPYQVANCRDGKRQFIYVTHDDPAMQVKSLEKYVIVIQNHVVVDKWAVNETQEQHSVMDEQMYREYD